MDNKSAAKKIGSHMGKNGRQIDQKLASIWAKKWWSNVQKIGGQMDQRLETK